MPSPEDIVAFRKAQNIGVNKFRIIASKAEGSAEAISITITDQIAENVMKIYKRYNISDIKDIQNLPWDQRNDMLNEIISKVIRRHIE